MPRKKVDKPVMGSAPAAAAMGGFSASVAAASPKAAAKPVETKETPEASFREPPAKPVEAGKAPAPSVDAAQEPKAPEKAVPAEIPPIPAAPRPQKCAKCLHNWRGADEPCPKCGHRRRRV